MADYNNPLEVQLKLTADATQITKTLEELKKQGIELPANLSKKNIDKAIETIQEQAKQKNISLGINESDFKNKIELITGAAKKRFKDLGIELRKVFEADSASGLQRKLDILKEIEALKKVTNFVPGLDTSFTAPDGKVIKTTKEYQEVLYGTIEALNKIKSTNFEKAVNANAEDTKLGLENLYNTSKKVLPVLANEFISLSKDTSTSADAMIGKFKEVYSVYKLFQSAASGIKKPTGESLPNTLSEKKYGDSINLDNRSFSETGKFGKVLKDILGDQQKVKDFTESIKKDSEQLQQIGLKAISSAVTNPISQVAGTKGLAEAKQELASANKEVNVQQQALNDTLKQDTTKQAITNFKRLAGETKDGKVIIGELQKTFDNLFIGTDKIISIEELSNVTNQINQLKDALVVLKKEKQLSVATNENFIKNEDIKPYEDQIKNVEKFIAILSEYTKKKQQIEELQAKADTIKNSSNGIISKEQQESLNQIIAEVNRIKPEAEKAEAAIVKLKNNYNKYLGANFKKPKKELIDGNEFLGKFTKSDLSENFLFIKNLNNIVTTLGNTMDSVSNKGRGMSSALTSALQNISQQSQDKINTSAEAIVKAEAEAYAAKGVAVTQGEINNLKQKNLELETQIANTSKQSQATLDEKLRLEIQLEEAAKNYSRITEQAKSARDSEIQATQLALELETQLKEEIRQRESYQKAASVATDEKEKIQEVNAELKKKNNLLQEKVNNNSGVSLEQFNQIKDSVVQLNKAIAEKSNGLSESSKKDIECFTKIKEAVDSVRTTVSKMYDGVGSENLSGKLKGLQSELKNVVPNDIIDTFVKKLNRIQITIEKFEANNAIVALKANIEKELTNIQFNATVPNSITGIGGVLSPSVQHINDGIIEAYKQAEILRTNFNLTEEEAKKINGEITKLISTMNNKKASGVLTPEDLQKFEEQKQKIKDLIELYNSYNKAIRDYSNILSKNKTLMNQASPMNQQALKDSMGNVGKIISSGINDESMRKYIEEVNTINSIAKEIKNEFNQIKLPTDLTAFINDLKTNRSYGISGSGLENLIIGYQKVNTELQRIATTDQEVTYAEKQNARTKLDDLGEQIRQFQIANKLLKEMGILLRQSQNRSFTDNNVSTYVADLERLKANFSNVLTTTMGNAGNLSSEAITHFRDEVGKSNVEFLNLRRTIEEGIGMDRTSTQTAKLNYQINKLITDMNLFKMQNSTFTKDFGLNTQFNELASSLQRVQAEGNATGVTVMQLKSQFANFKTSVQMAGKMGRSFGDELSYIASKIGVKALLGGFTYRIISYFRKMIDNVKELDTAMTSLKRVTDETEATYSRFEKTMGNVSQEIGTGYADLVNAVAEFSKLGYNIEQATELGKVASIYDKVGLIGNTDEAITSLVSIIKAFDISSNKAMDLVDKLNIVGNKFSTSSAEIGEGLQRSASSLRVANSTVEESIALFTAGQEIAQNSEKVGTALNALSMRIRGAKVELEEAGLETDEYCDSTAKLREALIQVAGVDIMENEDTFKKPIQIFRELSQNWDKLTDTNRAAALETIAGKQRSNVAAAIVENFDTAEKALEAMANPDVTALEELDKINESLEGRITKLGSAFEKLSNTFMNENVLKSAVSLFTELLNKVTNLTDKIGGLGVAVEAFFMFKALRGGGALNLQRSLMTSSGFDLSIGSNLPLKALMNNMKDATGLRGKMNAVFNKSLISEADINGISLYNHYVSSGVSAQEALNKTRNLMNTNAASVVKNTIKQAEAMQKQTGETQKAIVATEQLNIITKQGTLLQRVGSRVGSFVGKVSSMALSMGTTMLVMAAINKLIEFANKEKEAMKATAEATDEFNKQNKGLDELRESYIEICTSITDETEKTKALNEWKKTLAETYGVEEEVLKNINGTRKDGIDLINKESLAQKQRFLAENSKAGKRAESYVTSSPFVDLKSRGLFSKSAKTKREVYPKYLETLKGLYSETEDNRITFVEKMKQLEEELVSKQNTEGVTWESNEFLGLLRKDIEHFEEKLKGEKYKEIFEGFIDAEMSVKADAIKDNLKYLDIYKRTLSDMNIIVQEIAASKMDGGEEYYDSLLNRANQYAISIEDLQEAYSIFGDKQGLDSMQIKAFSDALKDLGVDINLMPNSTDEFISRLVALENELDEAKNKTQSLTSSIETARDSIKDISDIIDKQAEPNFFFDSTEMSKVLAKYPELQGHILECAYGYRIEENALNNLKQTKLEEQKIALQTTLDEQIAVYNSVQNKLNSYNAELNGIKTLTDAKIRMAEIDSDLNKISSNPLVKIVPASKNIISGKLNKEKETLQEYIDIQNAMEKTKNALLTSQTQIDTLGKSFKDVKKATDNINKNMEKVKKSTQDSIDNMKDAKQSIEDLLELTIEMIKKQKELEKEALEEQLDGFKAIIENKKKQLEIEKDIYNFQKDLNEKNTSISDIKKDLDNLSLDDSLEAQKKKAELEEQLAKEKSKLDDFLYEHEVETRKNALDEEEKLFEEKIDGQIKTIEEYLNKEGVIRQDAMNLINSRTQQLYNDLQNYATTYSKYTEAEFIKLWTTAYDYLARYGNGQIDISYSLGYLTGQTEYLTKYIEQLEVQADNATNALENLGNVDLTRVVTQLEAIEAQAKGKPAFFLVHGRHKTYHDGRQLGNHKYWSTPNLKTYHDGGVVTGGNEVNTGSSEIIAKLLKGEVVLNSRMQRNFFNKVIPDVYKAGAEYVTNNNSSNNPITIQQGDIIIQGNADKSTVSEIQSKMQETINKTLAKINDSKRRFGGMPNAIGY